MAPWVQRIFIEFLPKLLCIQRPKKEDEPQEVEEQPPEVLTDVFHVPPDVEKYSPFCTNKYSTDFDIPGELRVANCRCLCVNYNSGVVGENIFCRFLPLRLRIGRSFLAVAAFRALKKLSRAS